MASGIEFDWDDENRKHLAAHKVAPAEFEELLHNGPLDLDYALIDNEDRYRSVGLTNGAPPSCRWRGRCAPFGQEGFSEETPMKKQIDKQPKRVLPAFANEAEEAEWWYKNRNVHGQQMLTAVKNGGAQVLTKERLRERIAASKKAPAPVVALRIPEADLALARKQAEKKGLPYQTYIKSLLHETLTEREKRKAGW